MTTIATLALLVLQIASPPEEPPLLYPMYLLIIGGAVGAAAQRTVLRNLSPWTTLLAGIIGSVIGGFLGIADLGSPREHTKAILAGGFVGSMIGLAILALIKRSSSAAGSTKTSPAPAPPAAEIAPKASVRNGSPAPSSDYVSRPVQPSYPASSGDIFISYASADRPFAQRVATALQAEGWSVWWDRAIPPGKSFDAVIEEALDAAKCVIVLWSGSSVASDWVKVEAAEAARRHILIPALIANVTIPLEFRRIQAANLLDWAGSSDHPGFHSLTTSVRELLGAPR
jgi:uncharacterized membrane protein YeaQ/YmgE (transglycosylase-associated protein family)